MSSTGFVIDYASGRAPVDALDAATQAAAAPLLWAAALSGPCVAVCFAVLAQWPAAAMLHAAIFAVTLASGIVAAMRLNAPRQPLRLLLDLLAALALLGLGAAPLLIDLRSSGALQWIGLCFLVLAATTTRHLFLYFDLQQRLATARHWRLAGACRTLGVVKCVHEALWLGCCAGAAIAPGFDAMVLIAVVAFVGCLVFGIIWIWMIVLHARVLRAARQ